MRILKCILVFLALLAPRARVQAQVDSPPDIRGLWRTLDDSDGLPRALIRIEEHDGVFAGFAAGSLRDEEEDGARCERCRGALKNAPMRELQVLSGMRAKGDGTYKGGRIVDPDTGAEYSCMITLARDADSLILRGYIGIPAMGRSQRWERAETPAQEREHHGSDSQ